MGGIIVYGGTVAEGILEAARQEEMLEGLVLFLLRRGDCGKVKYPLGRNPPVAVTIEIDIAACVHSNAAKHTGRVREQGSLTALIHVGQQSRREGKLVAASRQRQGFHYSQRQQGFGIAGSCAQIVWPVEGAYALDQPPVVLPGLETCRVQVLVDNIVLSIAGGLHLGLYFGETKEVGYIRLGAIRLDLDQLEGACFGWQGRTIGVGFENGIGIAILRAGAQRGALLRLISWREGGIHVSTPIADGYGLQHIAKGVDGQRE